MIDLFEERLAAQVQIGKRYIPKECIVAFAQGKVGQKIRHVVRDISRAFDVSDRYIDAVRKLLNDNFDILGTGKLGELLDMQYKGSTYKQLIATYEIFMRGMAIVYKILDKEKNAKITEDEIEELVNISMTDVLKICKPYLKECGIEIDMFSFACVRQSLFKNLECTNEEVEKFFYNFVLDFKIFKNLISSMSQEDIERFDAEADNIQFTPYVTDKKFTFEEIANLSISELLFMFGEYLPLLINALNLSTAEGNGISKIIENFVNRFSQQTIDVLNRRNSETLESIGQFKGVTRERIRQLEARAKERFFEFYQSNFVSENKDLIFSYPKNVGVVPIDKITDTIQSNRDAVAVLIRGIEYGNSTKYIEEIDCLVSNIVEYEIFEDIVQSILGEYFKESDMEEIVSKCFKEVESYGYSRLSVLNYIKSKYKKRDKAYYSNASKNNKVYKVNIIFKKYFDEGMHFSDKNDLKKFEQYAIIEFGSPLYLDITIHNLQAIVERADTQLIGRGIYIHYSKAPQISENTMQEIISYIDNNPEGVAYSDIFETFKEELLREDIDNKYKLQGAMAKYKNKYFDSKRDYVVPIGVKTTLRESMKKWMLSQTGFFTYKDFTKEFKGVAESVFVTVRFEVKNIIYYWKRGYIRWDCLNITEEEKKKIKEIIEAELESSQQALVSVAELHRIFKIRMNEFLKKREIRCNYELFSILEKMFKDEYCFSNPLISKDKIEKRLWQEVFAEYIEGKDLVDIAKARAYVEGCISRHEFINLKVIDMIKEAEDRFIVVDSNYLASINKVQISESDLLQLGMIINNYLKNEEEVAIDKIVMHFQTLGGIKANKFLIYGIVNTYFANKYSVFQKDNVFRNGQLYIQRNK